MTVAFESVQAYRSIVNNLPNCQYEVLLTIKIHGPVSNKEIAKIRKKDINQITGRVTELREMELVEQAGRKKINGFWSKTWKATDHAAF